MVFRQAVTEVFNGAKAYQQKAVVQQRVAGRLAEQLGDLALADQPQILEIGCGTGFLSKHLINLWPGSRLLCTDIAPEMLARCQTQLAKMDSELIDFQVMDGENIPGDETFDLIVASLVFQWFLDPLGNLQKLVKRLKPGGRLVFVTLGPETFVEWRQFCSKYQLACGLHDYPSGDDWQQGWPQGGVGQVVEERIVEEYPSPQFFLKGLKEIGTALSPASHKPVSAFEMRRALHSYAEENKNFSITYHLIFAGFLKTNLDNN
ncbi:MAG: methyltransferase domain-containing protein [Magnetococcales bacterium]|nr:methyltransferase domain-containing protein [Magnetococcales bacterium]